MRRTDWLMCVKWRAKRRGPNERPPGVEHQRGGGWAERRSTGWRRGEGRRGAQLWMKRGPLMGDGEYWIRQRQMECARQRERNSDMSLLTSTLFPPDQSIWGNARAGLCYLRARASVRVPVWRERLSSMSPSIKIRKHSDITSAPLASQPLHMLLFNFGASNPIKAWEVWST